MIVLVAFNKDKISVVVVVLLLLLFMGVPLPTSIDLSKYYNIKVVMGTRKLDPLFW